MKKQNAQWTALAGAAAAGALGATAAAAVAAHQISGPSRPWPDYRFTPFEVGTPSEDVDLAAADGTALKGWWFDNPGSERVVICCHGHRGNKSDLLGIGPGLWRAGNTVMLFDFRGSGDSADGPQSLAHHEQQDLRAAIDHAAARRPDAEITVVGFSMGAAVTILVAAGDPRVAKVVLDSPFADMSGVISAAISRLRLPPVPLLWLTDQMTRARYGYRFRDVQPIDVIADIAPRPLLLLHGDTDRIIPVEHAYRLFAAAGDPKDLVIYPGVDHCGGYFVDRTAYIDMVAGFLAGTRHISRTSA